MRHLPIRAVACAALGAAVLSCAPKPETAAPADSAPVETDDSDTEDTVVETEDTEDTAVDTEDTAPPTDADGDGHDAVDAGGDDCDDTDPDVHPGAKEVYYDGVDADCDGASDFDADGDGEDSEAFGGTDCDDTDPKVQDGCDGLTSPLDSYVADTDPAVLKEVPANLSGITWNDDRGTYLAVLDSNRLLFELTTDMVVLREIAIEDITYGDTEDIVWLGADRYAITTEDGVVYIADVPGGVTTVDASTWQVLTYAPEPKEVNRGGEGIAFDPVSQTLWVCNEKTPMAIAAFPLPGVADDLTWEDGGLVTSAPFDAQAALGKVITDMASCLFDARTGRLLVLSQESDLIVDVALDGTVHGELSTSTKGASMLKPEGIALTTTGVLMVVGEPDEWRRFVLAGP